MFHHHDNRSVYTGQTESSRCIVRNAINYLVRDTENDMCVTGQKAPISIKIHPIPRLRMINRQIVSSRYMRFLTTIINQVIIACRTDFIFTRN